MANSKKSAATNNADKEGVRIDKWLWAARFYKTRSIARQMVETGKIKYDGNSTKCSKLVEVGAKISLVQGFTHKEVIVKGISDVRGPAPVAALLYEETPESIVKREEEARLHKMGALFSPHPDTKPNKKERRELSSLKSQGF